MSLPFLTYTVTLTAVPEVFAHLTPIIASSEFAAVLKTVGDPATEFDIVSL